MTFYARSTKLLDDVARSISVAASYNIHSGVSDVRIQADPYPLRGILAEQVGMNGEIKRPQRGGYLAGAQGPHRVPPAKAVRNASCQFPGGAAAVYRGGKRQAFGEVNFNFWLFRYHLPSVVQYIVHSLAPSLVVAVVVAVSCIIVGVCGSHVTRLITQRT